MASNRTHEATQRSQQARQHNALKPARPEREQVFTKIQNAAEIGRLAATAAQLWAE